MPARDSCLNSSSPGTCDCNLQAETNDVSSTYECRETHNEWPRNEHVN